MRRLKSKLAIILSFVLVFGAIFPGLGLKTAEAAPPVLSIPDVYYGEGSGPVPAASGMTLAGDGIYNGGYIQFNLQDARPGEVLFYPTVTEAVYGRGNVSIVRIVRNATVTDAVYLGTSDDSAKHIGDVVFSSNGGFRINFLPLNESEAVLITNGDFSNGTAGWDIRHQQTMMGSLASKTQGRPVSISPTGSQYTVTGVDYSFITDFNYTTDTSIGSGETQGRVYWGKEGEEAGIIPGGNFSSEIADGSLRLYFDGWVTPHNNDANMTYGSAFGPDAVSPGFTARAGDALAFDWKAANGGDDYEVYGFLVDALTPYDDVKSTELMYGRGDQQASFITSFGTVPADGDYKFRFVSGSYDRTGGKLLGASLYVDNVRVFQDVASDAVLEQIAQLVNYANNESFDGLTEQQRQRTVTVEVQNNNPAEKDNKSFTIQLEPQLKLESVSVNNSTPNQATLVFNLPVDTTLSPEDFVGFTVNGVPVVGVSSIAGNTVVVELENAVGAGALEVEYTGAGNISSINSPANKLKPIAAGDLDGGQVDNGVEPLRLIDLIVDGNEPANKADLIFNKPVDGAGLTVGQPIPGFTIGGKPVTVVAINGDRVSVSIDGSFEPEDKVVYTADGGIAVVGNPNNKLGDIDGDVQPNLTVMEDPLKLVSAKVNGNTPDQVTLTFNRPIDADSLNLSGFTVNGYEVDPNFPPVVDGKSVVLKLVQPVGAGKLEVLYDDEKGTVGSVFNPTTNLLGDITGADQAGIAADNGVQPLELIKVTTDPNNPAQLKLKFNMAIAKGGLTPGEALDGFTVGGKPVKFVGINNAGDEIIVRLDEPYQAGDQLAYDAKAGNLADAVNANNKLGDIEASDIPMVSGKLSGFGLSSGGKELALSPGFNPNKNNGDGEGYLAVVPNDVTSVSISPTAYNPNDTITKVALNGVEIDSADGGWDNLGVLKEGPNEITVKVYDKEDPSIVLEEYSIIVWRATSKLISLVPSEGMLNPEFDSNTEDYTIRVGSNVSSITLTPTALDPKAKIEISVNGGNKTVVASGKASGDLELQTGENTIVITVTDRLSGTVKEYTVIVNRESSFVYFPPTAPIITDTDDAETGDDDSAGLKVEAEGYHKRYVNGYPDGTFRPNQSVTRAEMAAMLDKIGAVETAQAGASFPDVAQKHWAANAISRVSTAGLMKGYPNGEFQPNGKVTRAEMAVIVFNYLNLSEKKGTDSFPDVAASHWANGIIASVNEIGIINGYPDGTFKPSRELSRAEAVTILNRLFERGPLYETPGPSWSDVTDSHWAYADIEEASMDHAYIKREQGGEQWVAE